VHHLIYIHEKREVNPYNYIHATHTTIVYFW
jgi:hypothetical protein